MKFLKRINYSLIVNTVFLILLMVWLFFLYQLYSHFSIYNSLKKTETISPRAIQGREEVLARDTFSSDFRDLIMFDIFSKGVKARRSVSAQRNRGNGGKYKILGVVKMDQLYAVVELERGNKLTLFAEKSKYNDDFLVEEIQAYRVVIRDGLGNIHTHNVFRYEEVKKEFIDNVIKLFESGSQSSPGERKKKPRRSR